MLSPHRLLGLPSGCFLVTSPTKIMHAFLASHFLGTCPVHHSLLDFTNMKLQGDLYRCVIS
jgi:hypothetical protein